MAGYYGYSMSNNAIEAYENGEKPYSKWRKSDILELVERYKKESAANFSMELLKKVNINILKKHFLAYSSWHHTSCHYNRTDFYLINEYAVENLTNEKIQKMIGEGIEEKTCQRKESEQKEEKWICSFLEWSGSRKHPRATEYVEEGIIKGNWFYRKNGNKKRTTAKGFEFLQKIE